MSCWYIWGTACDWPSSKCNLPWYVGKTTLGGPGHAGDWVGTKFKAIKDLLVQHHLLSGQTKVEAAKIESPQRWRKAENQQLHSWRCPSWSRQMPQAPPTCQPDFYHSTHWTFVLLKSYCFLVGRAGKVSHQTGFVNVAHKETIEETLKQTIASSSNTHCKKNIKNWRKISSPAIRRTS